MDNQQKQIDSARITSEGLGRFTKEEMDWMKATFKDNDNALKTLRKIFLPEYQYDSPIGQVVDLFLVLDLKQIPKMDRELAIESRNQLILHLEKQIQQIKILTLVKDETPEEISERLKQDSNK